MSQSYCFCTLAVGQRYRKHAKLLAADLQQHAPETVLVLLSDRPSEFDAYPNVRAYRHRLQSVKGYHDKRFVLEKAISQFESCVFVDADVRILGPIPPALPFAPGLVPRYGCGIIKHSGADTIRPSFEPIKTVAKALQLNLKDVLWFHEFMFLFSRQDGKEQRFFELWQSIAYYFESQGVYDGEGNVMGLAAAKSGLDITFHRHDFFPCFKDNIQKEHIKTGKASPDTMQAEFAMHKAIEYPQRSLIKKITDKTRQKASFYYRLLNTKISSAQDPQFRAFMSARLD